MGVKVSMWGAASSTPLDLAQVPLVGDSIVSGTQAYPVLGLSYANGELVYALVGSGHPFGGIGPAPPKTVK